jgi:hypothetical protein
MEEKDFLNKMEKLKRPEVNAEASRQQIKLVLMNTKKSATWGIWFLVIPVFFFCCVAIKYLLHWNWGMAGSFLDWMADVDRSMSFPIVSILLFIVLPGIGAIVNLLSVMHFMFDKIKKELIVTIKVKWINIILAVISICIIGVVLLYAVSENSAERAIKKYDIERRSK